MDSESPFLRRFRGSVSERELAVIAKLESSPRHYPAGVNLADECRADHALFILRDGWTVCYKLLRGGDRQILDLQIPGDVIGLRQVLFNCEDYRIEPVTDIVAAKVPYETILKAFVSSPTLATHVLWAATSDSAATTERVVSLGRRNACQRVVHFMLELSARLRQVGLGNEDGFACPMSQSDLADVLGLSPVHVSRVMRQLRERGLMRFHAHQVHFLDVEGMIEMAEFDTTYLEYQNS